MTPGALIYICICVLPTQNNRSRMGHKMSGCNGSSSSRGAYGRFALLAAACLAVSSCHRPGAASSPLDQCEASIAAGRCGDVLPLLKAEVAKTPDDAELVQWLGLAYWKQGQADKAVECFEKARRLLPADPRPSEYLGYVEMQRKLWPRAETALAYALRASPRNPRILTAMAVVQLGTNNLVAAQWYLKDAIRIESNYPPALYNLAWLNYYRRQNAVEAAPLFRRYLAVSEEPIRTTRARAILKKIGDATPKPPGRPAARTTTRRPTAR